MEATKEVETAVTVVAVPEEGRRVAAARWVVEEVVGVGGKTVAEEGLGGSDSHSPRSRSPIHTWF